MKLETNSTLELKGLILINFWFYQTGWPYWQIICVAMPMKYSERVFKSRKQLNVNINLIIVQDITGANDSTSVCFLCRLPQTQKRPLYFLKELLGFLFFFNAHVVGIIFPNGNFFPISEISMTSQVWRLIRLSILSFMALYQYSASSPDIACQ